MNLEAAQKVAEENGIAQSFGDVNEMLSVDEIDAVSIIVPNKFHAPLQFKRSMQESTFFVKSLQRLMPPKLKR